jgi:YD repeat-containing protein
VTWYRDRLGKITQNAYNGLRQLTSVTDPLGRVTSYQYCGCGDPSSITRASATPLAQTTSFVYDYAGRRTSVTYADGTYENYGYNLLGQLTSVTDTLGARTMAYNNQGLLKTVSNAFGTVQNTVFDKEDNPVAVTDANAVTSNQGFDWLGRVLARTNTFDSGKEYFGYSSLGLTAYTNQLSEFTRYAYDAAGRKTSETFYTAGGSPTHTNVFTYFPAGDLNTFKDPKGQITTWNYDEFRRVTNKLDQAGVEILRYTYDVNHRLATRWSKAKNTTSYGYDDVGNLLTVNYPASTDITLSYDALDRVTNMVDAAGTTKFTYDSAGNLASEDGPWSSDTVSYTYHSSVPHLRTSLTLQQPSGSFTHSYGYDAARRLQMLGGTAGTFTYTYSSGVGAATSASAPVKKLALPNSSYVTNTFDSVARLLSTKLNNSSHATLNAHSYLYNAAHERTRHTRTDGSYVAFTYDNLSQLKTAVGNGGQSTENLGYLYDAAWNLNVRTNAGTPTTFSVNVKGSVKSIDKLVADGEALAHGA